MGEKTGPMGTPPRKPSVPDVDTLVKFDNPDDAELEPESDSLPLAEDADTLVALDNPDDADMYSVDEVSEVPRGGV